MDASTETVLFARHLLGLKRETLCGVRPMPPFDRLLHNVQRLPCFDDVFHRWARAMWYAGTDHSPFVNERAGYRDRFIYLFGIGGDTAVGGGDPARGRERRLALMREAKTAGDHAFVNAIENAQRNRKKRDAFGNARELMLGAWIPLSLWCMDAKTAATVLGSLPGVTAPVPKTWNKYRLDFELLDWRDFGLSVPPVRTFEVRERRLAFAQPSELPEAYQLRALLG